MRYVTKKWLLIVSNGFFIENVGHTLTKNYDSTYWPLIFDLRFEIRSLKLPVTANFSLIHQKTKKQ